MRRHFSWLAVALLTSCVSVAAAQAPKAPETPAKEAPAAKQAPATPPEAPAKPPATPSTGELYPLKVGTKWTYKIGETSIEVRVASTDAEGVKLETLVSDKVLASEVIKVGPDAITRVKINNSKIEPPVTIIKLTGGKAVKDDKWTVDSKVQDSNVKGEFMVKSLAEKVTVPLGEFDAVLVEGAEFDVAGSKTAVKYWFVPGKGIVKLFYNIQGNEQVLELKEFVEPK